MDLPIALRKGTRSCTAHPISRFVTYDRLAPVFRHFALSVSAILMDRSYVEALASPPWKAAMDEEMRTLLSRATWSLIPRPSHATPVTCRWVFTVKHHVDGSVARYKARLVARGFTQTYGLDYAETLAPVARSIRILLSLALTCGWHLSHMDVKNAFLYGDLDDYVLMEQPPGYVAQGAVCLLKKAGLKQSPRAWFRKLSSTL